MSQTRILKLMAQYGKSPLWLVEGNQERNVPIDNVRSSPDLRDSIAVWQDTYQSTFHDNFPAHSGFTSPDEHKLFVDWGRELAIQLAQLYKRNILYFDDYASVVEVIEP